MYPHSIMRPAVHFLFSCVPFTLVCDQRWPTMCWLPVPCPPVSLPLRYPVVLRRFELRPGSGGEGKWRGGDGVVREVRYQGDRAGCTPAAPWQQGQQPRNVILCMAVMCIASHHTHGHGPQLALEQ